MFMPERRYNNRPIHRTIDDYYNIHNNNLPNWQHIIKYNADTKYPHLELNNITFPGGKLPQELSTYEWITRLDINQCNLTSLDGLPPNVSIVRASNNCIKSINNLPKSLIDIDVSKNSIRSITSLPDKLMMINAAYNGITDITCNLPNTLEKADFSGGCLTKIPVYGSNMKVLMLGNHNISQLPDILPPPLIHLTLSHNKLVNIDSKFPDTLRELNLANNTLINIANIPINIEKLDVSHNKLRKIDTSQCTKITGIDANDNLLSNIPDLSKCDKLYSVCFSNNTISGEIKALPPAHEIVLCNNYITHLCDIDKPIVKLNVSDNKIRIMPKVHDDIVELSMNDNSLTSLGEGFGKHKMFEQGSKLHKIEIRNNLIEMKDIPLHFKPDVRVRSDLDTASMSNVLRYNENNIVTDIDNMQQIQHLFNGNRINISSIMRGGISNVPEELREIATNQYWMNPLFNNAKQII